MSSFKYSAEHVTAYYSIDVEREWQRLIQNPEQEVKLHVHNHYLHEHLIKGLSVLEVGAGPGRFTQHCMR